MVDRELLREHVQNLNLSLSNIVPVNTTATNILVKAYAFFIARNLGLRPSRKIIEAKEPWSKR